MYEEFPDDFPHGKRKAENDHPRNPDVWGGIFLIFIGFALGFVVAMTYFSQQIIPLL